MAPMTEKDASTLTIALVSRYGLIWLGVLAGVGFYFLDAFVDSVLFNEGALRDQLLHPSPSELWIRTCVLLLAVAFATLVQLLLRREHATGERAKTAETFLNSIVDNIPNMIFIKDAGELRFIRVNKTGERLLGLSNQELIGKNDYDFFPEPQAKFFTQKDRQVLEAGIEINIPEEEIDTAALGKRWLHTRKVPILDDKGQPIYLLGISEDITESRQAEKDRKKTEVRFQTLFNSAADFIFVIDPEGKILQSNRYACDHSGYEKHEIIGSNIKKFFTGDSQDICDCNFPGLRERGYNRADIEFVCKDGHIIQMECVATGVPDESGCFTSFLIIQRDVTDKNRAQEEKQHQQEEMAHVMRLSSMGEMASGMAHELNQPLTALVSYCGTALKLAREMPSPPEGYIDILERASRQAHRAGEVIRHLREFVSKGGNDKTKVVLDDLIRGVIDFIRWDLRDRDIQVTFLPASRTCKIFINKIQIEQVLINLIRNSIEAIRGADISGGQVDIATRLAADGSTEISVADNGPGIEPSMSGLLFEPYQTSKETGMGMGLSISRSIIEAHNGKLWTDEQRQKGALFCMHLPGCE
jgi:PAS domain S-box-containing protein